MGGSEPPNGNDGGSTFRVACNPGSLVGRPQGARPRGPGQRARLASRRNGASEQSGRIAAEGRSRAVHLSPRELRRELAR